MQIVAGLAYLTILVWILVGLVRPTLAAATPVTRWATSRGRIVGAGLAGMVLIALAFPETPERRAQRIADAARADSLSAVETAHADSLSAIETAREDRAHAAENAQEAQEDAAMRAGYLARFQADSVAEAQEDSLKAAQEALVARFGRAPLISAWNGGSHDVERHLKAAARDPDSVETEGCTQPIQSTSANAALNTELPDGWLVSCTWRARNGFGGMNASRSSFVLKDREGLMTVIWTDAS